MEKNREERIDRFIENEMLQNEREAFCREMDADQELKEQVALRKLLIEAHLIEAEKEARKAMERPAPRRIAKRVWGMVAAVAVLVGVVWFVGNGYRYTPVEIYQVYYTPPIIETARTGTGLIAADAQTNRELMQFYQQQQYDRLVALFDRQWRNRDWSELPESSLLYVTVSLLECNRSPEAVHLLSTSSLLTSEYEEEAAWLLLCAYLQEGNREKAEEVAERILTEGVQYADKAAEMRDKLEEKSFRFGKNN